MKAKLTTIFIIAVTGPALLGVAGFIIWRSAMEGFLGPDVFKLTYQFLLITVVGGALFEIQKEIQRERDRRAAERNLQRQRLEDCVKAYNVAKKVRRLLRAKAIKGDPTAHVDRDPYDELMQDLMDAQLEFEALVARVEGNQTLFPHPRLKTDLNTMGDYLKGVLKDYETCLSKFSGSPQTLPLASASSLAEFTDRYKEGRPFDLEFKQPFHRVTKILENLITK